MRRRSWLALKVHEHSSVFAYPFMMRTHSRAPAAVNNGSDDAAEKKNGAS